MKSVALLTTLTLLGCGLAPGPKKHVMPAGTVIALSASQGISSRTDRPGQTMTATVTRALKDAKGNTVIPAGATVTLSIVQLAPSENKSDPGKLELQPTKLTVNGTTYPIEGKVTHVDYELKGRGVQVGDAAKVGAGAAAGAIVGRVLSGKGKGAVVGGVVGAAAGTAVAVETANRDVVIHPGARITVSLKQALELPVT